MTIRDMVARHSDYKETQDMIPTPPYATRVLYEYVAPELKEAAPALTAWEPAAGFGHMASVMHEYKHKEVYATDKTLPPSTFNKVTVRQQDFLQFSGRSADLIATNPPYKLLGEFIALGLERSNRYLALLIRVQGLEGQARYRKVFNETKPTCVALFSDRIPFKTGVVVRKAPKMFLHTWVFWDKEKIQRNRHVCEMKWVPPEAQRTLEKDEDYATF